MKKLSIVCLLLVLVISALGCKAKTYKNVDEVYNDAKDFVTSEETKDKVKKTGKFINETWLKEK